MKRGTILTSTGIATLVTMALSALLLILGAAPPAPALTFVTTISPLIGESPELVATSPNSPYVYVGSQGSFQVIDPTTQSVIKTVPAPDGNPVIGLFLSADAQTLYLATDPGSAVVNVWDYNPAQLDVTPPINQAPSNAGLTDMAMSNDGTVTVFANDGPTSTGGLTIFNSKVANNYFVHEPLHVFKAVAFSPDQSVFYALAEDSEMNLEVFSSATSQMLKKIRITKPVGDDEFDLQDLAVSPDGNTLIATDWWNDCIYVLTANSSGGYDQSDVCAIQDAQDVAIDPVNTYAYVTGSDGVTVVDWSTLDRLSTVAAGSDAYGIGYSYSAAQLYVSNATSDGTVTVLGAPALRPVQQTVSGTVGQPFTSQAVTASGFASSSLTFSVSPALPGGLTLDTTSGLITGTPTQAQTAQTYTLRVQGPQEAAIASVSIAISPVVTSGAPNAQLFAGTAFTGAPATAVGFDCAPTYAVTSGSLPAGVQLSAQDGHLFGTASQARASMSVTVTATCNGLSASFSQSLSITPTVTPATQSVTGSVKRPLSTAVLTGVGFTGPVVFAISPALPAGLALNPTTGRISGTVPDVLPPVTYTITGSDGTFTGTAQLVLDIAPFVGVPGGFNALAGTVYQSAAAVTDGFGGTVTFQVDTLPPGLSMDSSTGVVSGLAPLAQLPSVVHLTATDGVLSRTVEIPTSVAAVLSPADLALAPQSGADIHQVFTPIGFERSDITFTVSPALPSGVTLNSSTGVLSGVLTGARPAATYTVTATDGVFTATSHLSLRVLTLSPLDQTIAASSGVAFASEPLVGENFGGAIEFSVTPELPSWAHLDRQTGVLSGVPTERFAAHTFTITATNGSATAAATATLFVAPQLNPVSQQVVGTVGTALNVSFSARSFDDPAIFTVTPALPDGLTLNPATGTISGTPSRAQAASDYTVRASDGHLSARATLTLSIVPTTVETRNVVRFVTIPPNPEPTVSPSPTGPEPTSPTELRGPSTTQATGADGGTARAVWTGFGMGAGTSALLAGVAAGTVWLRRRWRP